MLTRLLVCEGACNPNLQLVEAAVAAFRDTERPHGWSIEPIPDYLAADLRSASTHTPHVIDSDGHIARCVTCGHPRAYDAIGRALLRAA